jgi:lysophospholipase L1-like esterase
MKKHFNWVILLAGGLLALSSCGINPSDYASQNDKSSGNSDFTYPGNMVASDLKIDGVLDEEEWSDPDIFNCHFGENNRVSSKIFWGEKGLTVGFTLLDQFISASTNYSDSEFVINSDNVEFYIDTKHDGGNGPQTDDYEFLINPEGYAMLQVGGGKWWGPWSGVVDYAVSIDGTLNNDADDDISWSVELFLPYETFGFDQASTVGIAFGCRNKTTNLTTSDWFGWTPDPQIPNTYVAINQTGVQTEEIDNYMINSGTFIKNNDGNYTSSSANSLMTLSEVGFNQGTITATMNTPSFSDNGIVFGLSATDALFWESGASYYFFFINRDSNAFLGKVVNGTWNTIQVSSNVASFTTNKTINLRVVVVGNTIYGLIDDTVYITYTDSSFLTGTRIGLRAGAEGVTFSPLVTSESTIVDTNDEPGEAISGFNTVSGGYKNDGGYVATAQSSLMIKSDATLDRGTLSIDAVALRLNQYGLVFGLASNSDSFYENNASYYQLMINTGHELVLDRVENGTITNLSTRLLTAGYSVNGQYNLKVSFEEGLIKGYFENKLLILFRDENPLSGNQFGIKSLFKGTIFSSLNSNSNLTNDQTDALIVGDSIMELWANASIDLNGVGSVTNLGVGGTTTTYWLSMLEIIKTYNPSTLFIDMGTNDLPMGASAQVIKNNYSLFINQIQEQMPDLVVVIIGIHKCPMRDQYKTSIDEIDSYLSSLATASANIKFIDTANLFLDSENQYINGYFADGLHLNRGAYKLIRDLIRDQLSLPPIDDTIVGYDIASGDFTKNDNSYVASSAYSILVNNSDTFINDGSFIAVNLQATSFSDNGLIFGLSTNNQTYFWESGVSYYFYFISINGDLVLSKIVDGTYSELTKISISAYQLANQYSLKVVWNGKTIDGYLNDNKLISYKDLNRLTGESYGIRANGQGTIYSQIAKGVAI